MKFRGEYRQYLLSGLDTLGIAQPALSAYAALTQSRNLGTLCRVSQKVRDSYPPEDDHNGAVLMFMPTSNPLMEFVLASALRVRNYKPILLANMGSLPLDTKLYYYWSENAQLAIKRHNLTRFEHEFEIPVYPIGRVLHSQNEPPTVSHVSAAESYRYEDIEITPYVVASTRKYLKRYRLDPSNSCHNGVYRDYLQAGSLIVRAIKAVTQDQDVIAGIFRESAYVHGGIPAIVLRKLDIPSYFIGGGRLTNHISVGVGQGNSTFRESDPDGTIKAVREYKMTDEDRTLLRDRLPQISGEAKRYCAYTPVGGTGLDPSNRFTVGVFSHLLWDAAIAHEEALFPDFYEWLRCTIDTLGDSPEMDVYLKAHPAEAIRGTDEYVSDWLKEFYPDLPSNIHFLPPDSQISFYKLMDSLDAGVVYASTTGAEMAYNNIPVVIGGYPPYIDYGIGFAPSDKIKFVELLNKLPELVVTPQMQARCERYLYHLFVNKQIRFPSFRRGETFDVSYEFLTSEEMDAIINPIIAGETVQWRNLSG